MCLTNFGRRKDELVKCGRPSDLLFPDVDGKNFLKISICGKFKGGHGLKQLNFVQHT